ncbi:MAG TPA: cytochrome P450 [Beijerinckiaceae bacterium]|jgi:cytochrome P450
MDIEESPPRRGLARASVVDTLAVLADVVLPTLGKGMFIRRPRVEAMSEHLGLDLRAVRRLQNLRARYGEGPILLATPLRPQGIILAAEDVHRVLAGAPDPFAPATLEKRSALSHFEPRNVLISDPPERAERRRFHDDLLESDRPFHGMADTVFGIIGEEARTLLVKAGRTLTWDRFITAWYAAARRLILGHGARDDHALTDDLAALRRAGNWAFLHPKRRALRHRFYARLQAHLDRAEPGSLAERIAARSNTAVTAPADQVAHWLFAFDAAGIATYRALALIAAHSAAQGRVRDESVAARATARRDLPFTRACLLESIRLWPTTPAILRETMQDLAWPGGRIEKNTQLLIFVPFFHRDEERLAEAHRFAPELWLGPATPRRWPLIPFSEGPGTCPAHHLVPLVGSAMIASLLHDHAIALDPPDRLVADRPLPGTLAHVGVRLTLRPGEA